MRTTNLYALAESTNVCSMDAIMASHTLYLFLLTMSVTLRSEFIELHVCRSNSQLVDSEACSTLERPKTSLS